MKILVAVYSDVAAWNIPDEHVERLRREFPHHSVVHARRAEDVLPLIGSAHIGFMGEIRPGELAAARMLQWIHSPAAGVGGMLFQAMRDSPVIISNSRGMSADVIAEHVLALTFALFRKLPLAIRRQSDARWAQDETLAAPPIRTLAGTSALLVGLGGIGSAVARRFAALGVRVTGVRRNVEHGMPDGVTAVAPPDAFRGLLPYADIVVIAAPHTASTRRMVSAGELERMRADAVLINVSRGQLVDEAALAGALAAKTIGGAGLDVFDEEPLPPTSPLWRLPNLIITPHTSGFRPDHWDAATALFAENLRRFDAGQPLLNVVDKEAGY